MSRNSPSDVATEPPPAPAEAAAARRWRLLLRCRHPPARLLSPYSSSSSPAGHAASRALSLSALASFLAARRCPPPNTDILLPLRRLLTVLRSRHRAYTRIGLEENFGTESPVMHDNQKRAGEHGGAKEAPTATLAVVRQRVARGLREQLVATGARVKDKDAGEDPGGERCWEEQHETEVDVVHGEAGDAALAVKGEARGGGGGIYRGKGGGVEVWRVTLDATRGTLRVIAPTLVDAAASGGGVSDAIGEMKRRKEGSGI
uniref:Uncharacterized protein n=1 Tax=Oryza sativa subsp. japonica TaxID=39947 RepID=Q6EP72_ORYSJ|nr:hypothetical protein [Oryza sativa Japonica Group]